VPFKITSIRLIGGDSETARIVRQAASTALPEAEVSVHATIGELPPATGGEGVELLVLAGAIGPEEMKLAEQRNSDGMPRWVMIGIGSQEGNATIDMIRPEDLSVSLLAQAFRSSLGRHSLARENARLRGDLFTMAGRVSHDLKTPLNGILAAGEAMKEVLLEKEPASASLSGALFNSVDEMVRLMNRINFMLKASLAPVSRKSIPMADVVWTTLQRLEGKIRLKRLSVIKPEAWPQVNGVEPWLEIIWGNLIGNVLEHAGAATEIELGWEKKGGEYLFWVRDNGNGVSLGRQKNLFRSFHTLHVPETGHGLGLSIVQRLVDLHGGRVGYEPVSGGGSRFTFSLPV
jgi:signal transduction histidine kinase